MLTSIADYLADKGLIFATAGVLLTVLIGSGVFSYLRRPRTLDQGDARYFEDQKLLTPPLERPAYSDRMAYVLAEMSALAYIRFEEHDLALDEAVSDFKRVAFGNEDEVRAWLDRFADRLLLEGMNSEAFLRRLLEVSGFSLLGTVDVDGTQAFMCRRDVSDEPPYLVLSFRGTEKKVEDWLTDARAVPTEVGASRIHTGFYQALNVDEDAAGRTALDRVQQLLDSPEARSDTGAQLPLFICGHSLGGALALLTARELALDVNGACYTFGAPRVANYGHFEMMKTPVFRVVNSVDIVPRVPPGAVMSLLLKVTQFLVWITRPLPPISRLFRKLEALLDSLNGYRHFGDLRYLTDVKTGRFDTVKLLSNPPAIDRILWMGQHLRISFFAPAKSHGMAIYRNKLAFIANARNRS